jgi:hypothetical protein
MKLYSPSGRLKGKNVSKNRINWEGTSKSEFQRIVKQALFPFWKNEIVYEEFPVFGTRLSVDFYNATRLIAVEVQGIQHMKYTPYFHARGRDDFLQQIKKDEKKRQFCLYNQITLVEIFPEEKDKLTPDKLKSLGLV